MTIVKLYELILKATVKALNKASQKAATKAAARRSKATKKVLEANIIAKELQAFATLDVIESERLKHRAEKLEAAL